MKGYGSQACAAQPHIDVGIDRENHGKRNDKRPRSAKPGHAIGDAFAPGFARLDDVVRIPCRARSYQLLRGVKLASQHGKHIHPRMRLARDQNFNVAPCHFHADGFAHGVRVGLVGRLVEHGRKTEELAVAKAWSTTTSW